MGSEVQFTELIQLAEPLLHRDIGERLLWEWVVFLCCEKDYFRGFRKFACKLDAIFRSL